MAVESWRVRNSHGEEIGSIKKFIIDANTRQISYVDVLLSRTEQLVRVPWNILAVENETIWLNETAAAVSSSRRNAWDLPKELNGSR
jgi:hypothetical protein